MKMQSVFESLAELCENPVAWALIALVAAKALYSIVSYKLCPLARKSHGFSPEQATELVDRRVMHDPRFLALMIVGIALAIGGLYALPTPEYGMFGLAAVVLGSFILIVEPSQLSINENELRVAAAGRDCDEAFDLAVDRLRSSHRERIGLELGLTGALAAMIVIL